VIEMGFDRVEKLRILDVPGVGIGPPGHIRTKLPEAPMRITRAKLSQRLQED
jgi:hypothetical protein